ncbi:MAG: nucleoside monophosphate kinase [Candidatus Pacebacteria bacterium]|nr:nucleoside monophosphate kinase [Candidatus Paceibacterota bacterium]
MASLNFPLFKTKTPGVDQKFDITSPQGRQEYFQAKAGPEIAKLKKYLQENSFIAYLLGKKNSGKGTYAKMLAEIVDADKIVHLSIGDMVRELDGVVADPESKKDLVDFLQKNYRGYLHLDDIIKSLEGRSTKVLLPSELILALVKKQIADMPKKAIFIDGFPRSMDQISYSLFFRDLMGYRDDPDIFVMIDVPEKVIDERIKYRLICPLCQTSRNLKLLTTTKPGYDEKEDKFYLNCDNPACPGAKMVTKEGDEQGIEPIKERLKIDEELMRQAVSLYGVPKIFLRNSVPVNKASELLDDYEITPEYTYQQENGVVKVGEKPWQFKDDDEVDSYSLMPPAVVLSLIKQLVEILGI